eukprot:CAMPEP_0170172092 /NCGR_PEP_ID=MMETSP0040_2-20121228/5322_1 /TAXON_ID=641309 /ORGANISM="Lotharella oceanica, Strain CCMP622" /LENGTH=359 /DNA_ID=CAMNT_0010412571 /DNA_START=191 /DNA_END=1270 /DNA_ORIENTATION=-
MTDDPTLATGGLPIFNFPGDRHETPEIPGDDDENLRDTPRDDEALLGEIATLVTARLPFVIRGLKSVNDLVEGLGPSRLKLSFGETSSFANIYTLNPNPNPNPKPNPNPNPNRSPNPKPNPNPNPSPKILRNNRGMMSGCSDVARRIGDCAGDPTEELTVHSILDAAKEKTDHVAVPEFGRKATKPVDRNLYFSAPIDVGTDSFVEAAYTSPPLSWLPSSQYDNLRLRMGLGALQYRAHYDGLDNYVIQVDGTKLFLLLHPLEKKYIYPKRNEPRRSRVDFRNPQLNKNPRFAKALGFWHRLLPGDVLFLPRSWWHYVESEDPREFSRNGYWLTLTRHAGQLRGDGLVTFCAGAAGAEQ